jgi:hypothetical protein
LWRTRRVWGSASVNNVTRGKEWWIWFDLHSFKQTRDFCVTKKK